MPKAALILNQDLFLLVKTLINIQIKAFNSSYSSCKAAHEKDQETWPSVLTFKEKDKVLYHNPLDHPRRNKLATIWDGPFEIIAVLLADAYTIKNLSTGIVVNFVHNKYLKIAIGFNFLFIAFLFNLKKKYNIYIDFKINMYLM